MRVRDSAVKSCAATTRTHTRAPRQRALHVCVGSRSLICFDSRIVYCNFCEKGLAIEWNSGSLPPAVLPSSVPLPPLFPPLFNPESCYYYFFARNAARCRVVVLYGFSVPFSFYLHTSADNYYLRLSFAIAIPPLALARDTEHTERSNNAPTKRNNLRLMNARIERREGKINEPNRQSLCASARRIRECTYSLLAGREKKSQTK